MNDARAEQLEKCRAAIEADEEIAALVKKLARGKYKGPYSPDREPLARAISKHYKKGRRWRDWLVSAQAMIEEHRSLLAEPPAAPPQKDVEMREAIRRYVFNETHPEKHDVIRRLWAQWEEWNEQFFDGRMTVPIILLNEPSNPRRLGDCGPVSGFGCSSQIRIRPSLLAGTITEGKWRYIADVLLHEMVHQWAQEITGKRDKGYSGHGPAFADKANEIAQKLRLPEVGKSCKKDRHLKNGEPSPSYWPANVRPADYYGFAAKSSCVSISEDNGKDGSAKGFYVPSNIEGAVAVVREKFDVEEFCKLMREGAWKRTG